MADDPYLNTLARMEPGITKCADGSEVKFLDRDSALISIAISLKRIADSLERANLNGDVLANAIEGAIYRGLQK